jgi:hypothetical protein
VDDLHLFVLIWDYMTLYLFLLDLENRVKIIFVGPFYLESIGVKGDKLKSFSLASLFLERSLPHGEAFET